MIPEIIIDSKNSINDWRKCADYIVRTITRKEIDLSRHIEVDDSRDVAIYADIDDKFTVESWINAFAELCYMNKRLDCVASGSLGDEIVVFVNNPTLVDRNQYYDVIGSIVKGKSKYNPHKLGFIRRVVGKRQVCRVFRSSKDFKEFLLLSFLIGSLFFLMMIIYHHFTKLF